MAPTDKPGTGFHDNTFQEKSGNNYTVTTPDHQDNKTTRISKMKILAVLCILMTDASAKMTYFSVLSGLVLYCTSALDIGQADAVTISLVFSGAAYLTPVLGGFVADSYFGRFKTILSSSVLCAVGSALLTASAIEYETWGWQSLSKTDKIAVCMTGVMCIALALGGLNANVVNFGAQQVKDLGERAIRSYFNWYVCMSSIGVIAAFSGVSYIQQNISFAWGFFVPMAGMIASNVVFTMGRSMYIITQPTGSVAVIACGICLQGGCKSRPPQNHDLPDGSEKRILARAKTSFGGGFQDHLVDGVVSVIRVSPFCLLVIMYWAVFAQVSTTFFVQSERMDVRVGDNYIPAAALQITTSICVMILVPVFDRGIYPCFEQLNRPLTYLKRLGMGMLMAVLAIVVTGVVEIYRKESLQQQSHVQVLAGQNFTASSMSVFVQIPQFALIGAGHFLVITTQSGFAFNQAPVAMQGVLFGLFETAQGVGSWASTAILAIVQEVTEEDPWWSDDINNCKMEYLMFLLGGLLLLNFFVFYAVAHFYTYQDPATFEATATKHDMEMTIVEQKQSHETDIPNKEFTNNID